MATQQKERNSFGSTSNFGEAAKDTASKAGDMAKDTAHKAGDMAKDTANKAGDMASKAGTAIRDTAERAGEAAKDMASKAGEFVKDTASAVVEKTGDAASYVGHKADDAASAVGSNIRSFAGTIRDKGPHDGILGAADAAVASTLETCGTEMEQGISGMAEDLTGTIRKYPIPAVILGIGLGFLVARTLTR